MQTEVESTVNDTYNNLGVCLVDIDGSCVPVVLRFKSNFTPCSSIYFLYLMMHICFDDMKTTDGIKHMQSEILDNTYMCINGR